MPEEQRVFPDPNDLGRIPALIEQLGGVDIAFGGIGITGHLAFNEPQPELTPEQFAQLPTRVLDIHPRPGPPTAWAIWAAPWRTCPTSASPSA